jgi:hypothetical protein
MLWLVPPLIGLGALLWNSRRAPVAEVAPVLTPVTYPALPAYASSALVAPEIRVPAAPMMGPGAGQMLPQAAPTAWIAPSAPAYAPEPAMSSPLPESYMPAQPFSVPAPQAPSGFGPPPPPPQAAQPIAIMATTEKTWIRPEPRPWDDRMGRFGFTAPGGFVLGVLSYGPVGWAHVAFQHPDDGPGDGWIETRFLGPVQQQPAMPMPMQAAQAYMQQQMAAQGASAGKTMPGAVVAQGSNANTKKAAMSHAAFMSNAVQGRTTPRQKHKMKQAQRRAQRAA